MILDPLERLGSDESLTEKTIELDDGYQGIPLAEEEEEKRLDEMKKWDAMRSMKKRRDDVDVDEGDGWPPTPTLN